MPPARDTLHRLLGDHHPSDPVERDHLARMRALLDAPGDPFARARVAPGHFTASAFVLSPGGDALLLIHHGKLHRWLQPGGHIDPEDPTVEAAARREVEEETGVTELSSDGRIFDVDVHLIPARKHESEHHHFDIRLLFTAAATHAEAGSDAGDVRWVHLDDVEGLDTDASVLRAVRKLRARG